MDDFFAKILKKSPVLVLPFAFFPINQVRLSLIRYKLD